VARSGHGEGTGGVAVEAAVCGEEVWEEEQEVQLGQEAAEIAPARRASRESSRSVRDSLEELVHACSPNSTYIESIFSQTTTLMAVHSI
jgi:hypothetical protein